MNDVLWVGCMTDESGDGGLVRLRRHGDELVREGDWPLPSPAWLERRDGIVYASLHTDHSEAVSLRLTEAGPEVISRVATRGADACHLAISPDGHRLAVAQYTSGSVALVAVDEGARLRLLDVLDLAGHSGEVPDRQQAPHAHQCWWLTDELLLVCDLGADLVRRMRVVDDRLTELSPIEVPPGFGPRHLVVRDLDGTRQLAVVGELSSEVATFWLDDDSWRPVGVYRGTTRTGGQPSGVRLDEVGRLWVGQRGIDTIACLPWHDDGSVGEPTETELGGGQVRDLVLEPAGAPVTVWTALLTTDRVTGLRETDPDEPAVARVAEAAVRAPAALLWT